MNIELRPLAEIRPYEKNPRINDAARLLSAAGGTRVTAEMIRADVAAGAPTNADGTINLVHYAAWLIREMFGHDD